MNLQRYGMVSDGKRYHAMQRSDDGEYVKFADVAAMNGMYQDVSNAAADAGERAEAYRSFVANECLAAGIPAGKLPAAMPFNDLVRMLVDKRVSKEKAEAAPNRLRRAAQLIVSAQVDLDALDLTGELPRSFHIGGLLRTLDQAVTRIENVATGQHVCQQCGGLGSPPGEAAGLVCGECNGTGEKRRAEDEPD